MTVRELVGTLEACPQDHEVFVRVGPDGREYDPAAVLSCDREKYSVIETDANPRR